MREIIFRSEYTLLKQNHTEISFPVLNHANGEQGTDGAIHVISFKRILRELPRGCKQYHFCKRFQKTRSWNDKELNEAHYIDI